MTTNVILSIEAVDLAENYVLIKNSTGSNPPIITVEGTDTDIGLNIQSVGTLPINLSNFTVQSSTVISSIIDDDSMATASANNLPTSESVKAYVDSEIGSIVPGFNQINIQRVTAPGAGTYTPTSGMTYVLIKAQAAGGGGGGAATSGAVNFASGSGGGGGEYIEAIFTAAQIGASKSFSVGAKGTGGSAGANNGTAGGNTTFNTNWIITTGGSAGNGGASLATTGFTAAAADGGAGGSVATGSMISQNPGGASFPGFSPLLTTANGGFGGNAGSGSGGGKGGLANGSGSAGSSVAANSGAGGGGGATGNAADVAGGDGGDGYLTFIEYII